MGFRRGYINRIEQNPAVCCNEILMLCQLAAGFLTALQYASGERGLFSKGGCGISPSSNLPVTYRQASADRP